MMKALAVAAIAMAVMTRDGSAQRAHEADDARLRNNCRLAAQVLTSGNPAPQYEWAIDVIQACDQSGGPALAAVWRAETTDLSRLDRLVYTTSRLRDRSVLQALIDVARTTTRTDLVRLSALRVLIAYFEPGRDEALQRLQNPPFGSPIGFITEFAPTESADPLPATTRDDILALTQQLATSDPSIQVRNAARFVNEGLNAIRNEGGP